MESKITILDGAMGTMLQKAGLKPGEHPEVFGYNNPNIVIDIHKKYIEAGSDIVYTNTFGANSHKLSGCELSVDEAVKSAVHCAKEAAKESAVKVALDVGPIGELLEPLGTLAFEEAYEVYKELMIAGEKYGVDLIVCETFTDLYDVKAAVLAAKENTKLPIWVTMSYEESGRTFTGTIIPSMALTLEGLGVDAMGFNCSLGPLQMRGFIEELRQWTKLPIILKPNAGLPDPISGAYDLSGDDFAKHMETLSGLDVSVMGGCCGTDPEYINLLKEALKENKKVGNTERPKQRHGVCSATHTTEFKGVRVIGERLNPTGKKRFAQALLERDMNYISKIALEEEECGAEILDVNVGVPGADEVLLMIDVVKALQGIVSVPLQIDSSNPEAIEAGLRVYNGKSIINSVNADDEKLDKILPIAKKYGAAVIALALNEEGIPDTVEKRVEHAEYILKKALEYGLKKEDIIIDCLTLTVSAQQEQAVNTLRAVEIVSKKMRLNTTLGVSNISFGLPERKNITESFLIQAMYAGLNLPIINPNISSHMDAVVSFRVLSGEDENCNKYIERFANVKSEEEAKPKKALSHDESIESAILKGLKAETKELAESLLETMSEVELINQKLIPALDIVGEKYEKQEIFLPQLINSANAACEAFELVKLRIAKQGKETKSRGKIALATVKGDIHDIGKNIVKVILENYGYKIIDLGRDVSIEKVVKAVIEDEVGLVGLSALMTTTLPSMKETIEKVKEASPNTKVWVGGAVLTEDYAYEIGADYYAKDARASVDIAKKAFGDNDES
mgnify:FL=1